MLKKINTYAFIRSDNFLITSFLIICSAVLTFYLVSNHAWGYPLDDAWIHLDFARTWATTGRFAFASYVTSGSGSTSPLWDAILAIPYLIWGHNAEYQAIAWSYIVGIACLLITSYTVAQMIMFLLKGADQKYIKTAACIGALSVVFEWHLLWASLSGMETILFTALSLLILLGSLKKWSAYLIIILGALLVATRPEGIILLGLICISHLIPWKTRDISRFGVLLTGSMLIVISYFLFNLIVSGSLLPSTVFAKNAYYLPSLKDMNILDYLQGLLNGFLFASPIFLLTLPGLLYWLATYLKQVFKGKLSPAQVQHGVPFLWVIALVVAYTDYLPFMYHNGRYLMPVLPVLFIYGVVGTSIMLDKYQFKILGPIFIFLFGLLGVFSTVRGAQIYADDSLFINKYQVSAAKWLAGNIPPDSVVSTHDIGAIGYFYNGPIIDMGGLIQPDLIPYVSNQDKLFGYLKQHNTKYIVMFPDWFPGPSVWVNSLASHKVIAFSDPKIRAEGTLDFTVYKLE